MKKTILALCFAAGLTGPAALHAQLPADSRWETIESEHFRVTYERGLDALARRAAASAERAHAGLSLLVADAPRGTIDIVVADNVDFSNGYATPFPSNRIVIYAKPPVDELSLQYMEDWIDLVVVHELAHTFHLDVTGGLGRMLRTVFGRVPTSWPFFPTIFTPGWSVEGLATGIESILTDAGRVHGSYHEMVVRTAVRQNRFDSIDLLGASSPQWPGGGRIYIYGSLFMDYLTRRFGVDATARIVRTTGGALLPPALWYDNVARGALGVTFRQAYADWRAELAGHYALLADELAGQGMTTGEPLTSHGIHARHPRFSPDGSRIAYAGDDWRRSARVRVIDAATGAVLTHDRTNALHSLAWLPDGGVLGSDVDFVDRFRAHSDLYVRGGAAPGRLTRGLRLQDPDVTADGRTIVAVENRAGTNRLVLLDRATLQPIAITEFDPGVHWSLPRFSPDGSRIAAGRWRSGGDYQVVVLDAAGRTLFDVTGSPGINASPAWSPDGRWLLFWSDRTGIPNLYAADVGGFTDAASRAAADTASRAASDTASLPRMRQITNVITGAYHPDVSPDGLYIVYSAYQADGFRLERMPFDTATWRDPMPEHFAELAERRPAPAEQRPDDANLAAAVRAAVAAADTSAGPARPYRAAASVRPFMWTPLLENGGHRGDFFGFWTMGADLVQRHEWELRATLNPTTGRSQAGASYTFRGLPTLPLNLHPAFTVAAERDWDTRFADRATDRFIDEREDRAEAGVSFTAQRWRAVAGLSFTGELVRAAQYLHGSGFEDSRLLDPVDDLMGARVGAYVSRFVMPPFAISRENGFIVQATARQRWDRNVTSVSGDDGTTTFDAGYRELTTRNAVWLALPLPGFARHVLAARVAGLLRDGPGAGFSGVGGVSGATIGVGVPGFVGDIGGTSRLLPVRGFPENQRIGNRGWATALEYRLPVAMPSAAIRPLPIFVDRISAAAFLDAGHAWCDDEAATRFPTACVSTSAADAPLLGAGGEATVLTSFWGLPLPLRFGVGVPVRGGAPGAGPRAYFAANMGF